MKTAIRLKLLLEPGQIAVAASGIHTRNDIEKNRTAGIWNYLIGESLVRSKNPQVFLKSLWS
jgi:indole-3-glycerol phosphate synthase